MKVRRKIRRGNNFGSEKGSWISQVAKPNVGTSIQQGSSEKTYILRFKCDFLRGGGKKRG